MAGISALLIASAFLTAASAQNAKDAAKPVVKGPWLDKNLSPDQRADLLIQQMTLEEKITLVHGVGEHSRSRNGWAAPATSRGFRAWGSPPCRCPMEGRGSPTSAARGRYATALPSALANAASWDLQARTISARCWARKFATWDSTCRWAGPPTSFASRATGGTSSAWARTLS